MRLEPPLLSSFCTGKALYAKFNAEVMTSVEGMELILGTDFGHCSLLTSEMVWTLRTGNIEEHKIPAHPHVYCLPTLVNMNTN